MLAFRLLSPLDSASTRLPQSLKNNSEAATLKAEREELISATEIRGDPRSVSSGNKEFATWVNSQSSANALNDRIDKFTELIANASRTIGARKKAARIQKRIAQMHTQRSEIEKGNVLVSTVLFGEEEKTGAKPRTKRKLKAKVPPKRKVKRSKTAQGFITETKKRKKSKPVKQKSVTDSLSRYFI